MTLHKLTYEARVSIVSYPVLPTLVKEEENNARSGADRTTGLAATKTSSEPAIPSAQTVTSALRTYSLPAIKCGK